MKQIRSIALAILGVVFVATGLNVAGAMPASASTSSGWCTGANQAIDPVSGNCVTSTLTEGQLQATVNESLKGKAYLDLVTSGNYVLNVHTQPIPKQLINRCWQVKPGTVVLNTVVNPLTGQTEIIHWVVPKGDNTFCTEKGHGNQVFKKSCGNKEYNVPGQPHQPRPPKAITKGRFTVVNYVKWEAMLLANLSKHLAGMLSVESADHTCQASSSFDNDVLAKIYLKAIYKSRWKTVARATGAKKILVQAQTGSKASGKIAYAIKLKIKNKLSAMCNTSVPPSLPTPPSISVSAKGCIGPQNPTAEVDVNATDTSTGETAVKFVLDNQPSKQVSLTNGQASASFTVTTAGTHSGSVTGIPSGLSSSFSVDVPPCPVQESINITSTTGVQMIDAGMNSGPAYFTVHASAAGGSSTVSSDIGSVSTCDSSTPADKVTFTNLVAGDNTLCVIIWAPNDAAQPATMTVDFWAFLGSASDHKSQTVNIQYPVR